MWQRLVASPISFSTDLDLEKCASYINALAEGKDEFSVSHSGVSAELKTLDENHIEFILHKDAGRGLNLRLVGRLTKQTDQATFVTGTTFMDTGTGIFLLYMLMVSCLLFVVYPLAILSLIALILILGKIIHEKNQLKYLWIKTLA